MVETKLKGLESTLDSRKIIEAYKSKYLNSLGERLSLIANIAIASIIINKSFNFIELTEPEFISGLALSAVVGFIGYSAHSYNAQQAFQNATIDYLANGKFTKYNPKE